MTIRRAAVPRRRWLQRIGSPPVRRQRAASGADRSIGPSCRDGSQRAGRTGATTFILSMICASSANSSAPQSAKSLSRNSSISDASASRVGEPSSS